MLRTLNAILWSPKSFFASLPARNPFQVVAGVVLWTTVAMTIGRAIFMGIILRRTGASLLDGNVAGLWFDANLTAGTSIVTILISSAAVYVCMGAERAGRFARIVACLAYAQAPMALAAVPKVGALLGELWTLWLMVACIPYAFGTSWQRAVLPLLACWLLMVVAGVVVYHSAAG